MRFAEMMQLEPHGPDTWVGTGPRYPWGGLYGGQIVAQGLRAAGLTVEPRYRPHSLHAYFIRPGDHAEPIRFEVDRDRDGRSFCTRRVVARQSIGVILNVAASFHVAEESADVQGLTRSEVRAADGTDDSSWSGLFERRTIPRPETGTGRSAAWLRLFEETGDDALLAACGIAYLSDDMPTEAMLMLHPELAGLMQGPDEDAAFERVMNASLDHALWFHELADPGHWQLHDNRCERFVGSRGLVTGHVFTAGGLHVATLAQQGLLRLRG